LHTTASTHVVSFQLRCTQLRRIRMDRRRVVVTGMGVICPVGNTVEEAWRNAREGVSGIDTIKRIDTSELQVHFAGEVKNFDAKAFFGHREVRRMDRVTQLAMTAALEAVRDS